MTGPAPERDATLVRRHAMARDASPYRLVPKAVVQPRDIADVQRLLSDCRSSGEHVTFRSGGTSLSGQAVSDGVVVDVRRHFRAMSVLDGGAALSAEPGVSLHHANAVLQRWHRRLGPDPASEIACTIGGVVANNSSGMTCGTERNSYRTLRALTMVLASGTVIDTSDADADEHLRRSESAIHSGLSDLRNRLISSPRDVAVVRRLFAMKNTMGYGLNSLLDFERPVDILAHLMVGSEGTLGFVASATFDTIPVLPYTATGLVVLPDISSAVGCVSDIAATGADAIELMDSNSLSVAQGLANVPPELVGLEVGQRAALLVEYRADSAAELREATRLATRSLVGHAIATPHFTSNRAAQGVLWSVRKGLYAAVAAARPARTTALLEDIAVPPQRLAETSVALRDLMAKYGHPGVTFGHAKDGNLHFMVTEDFADSNRVARYADFTEEMVQLVLSNDGTLKAEHGTGRIMAPFVRRQYGDALYEMMCELKQLLDPWGVLNPGAVLTDGPSSYLRDLKGIPAVGLGVDACVECGYCEPSCPSKDVTVTPRQRIVLLREAEAARLDGNREVHFSLTRGAEHEIIDTCAADGLCEKACPVDINTGSLVRELREQRVTRLEQAGWTAAARHWAGFTKSAALALSASQHAPGAARGASRVGRALLGNDRVPMYDPALPKGGSRRSVLGARAGVEADRIADVVYFPSCLGSIFGAADAERTTGVADAFMELCRRAGISVRLPEGIDSLCCGTPWKSKGHEQGAMEMTRRVRLVLLDATEGGRLPVVCDASSCCEGLLDTAAGGADFGVIDVVAYLETKVADRLVLDKQEGTLVLHPTCSSERAGTTDDMRRLAERISDHVVVPDNWGCCGYAGDRGLLHPELTAGATAAEATEVRSLGGAEHVSSNRTCEIAMTTATGARYRHIAELLEEVTRSVV